MTTMRARRVSVPAQTSPIGAGSSADRRVDVEALFKEAKRRRRRRRLLALGLSLLALAATVYVARFGQTSRKHAAKPVVRPEQQRPAAAAELVTLEHPYGLAVASSGTLYVSDTGRDQVLRRLADGRFVVVAGNGRQGFAGDGGPATSAELRLTSLSGIAEGSNGDLYISDSGNARVRAVLANGTIETVAGDGHDGMLRGPTPGRTAAIGPVAGLAIGPGGDLYVAASTVLHLTRAGVLNSVAGTGTGLPACGNITCNPAGESDFTSPDQLAFDGAGDLFISDENGFGLYEDAANGALSYLGQFRGDGAPGALASAPDGSIVEAWRDGLTRRTRDNATTPIRAALDAALSSPRGSTGNIFIAGDGVSVASNGDIYLDTNTGNSFTTVSALVRVTPNGRATILWKS